jgi:hypothetical protein
MDISNITSVDQLQNALKPSNDQRKMAFWQGLFNAGTAMNQGQGLGAGLAQLGASMQAGKQPNQKILEQIQTRSALQKLLQPDRKAPTTRTVGKMVNGIPYKVDQEFDDQTGQWKEVGTMEQKDWNAPKQYDSFQNQLNDLKLRDLQSQIESRSNPKPLVAPSGFRFTQEGNLEAIPGGPADVKNTQAEMVLNQNYEIYKTASQGLADALENTETGYLAGKLPAITAAQQTGEGAVAAMAPVLKQLFRTAGEGTFTDKDQELLLKMVPTRNDEPEARANKLANIDAIVRAKLSISPDGGTKPATPPATETPANSGKVLRYNPQTGKLE